MKNPLKFPFQGNYNGQSFEINRANDQHIQIYSLHRETTAYAMGLAHWLDRAMQMYLQKIVVQGRVAELLEDTQEALEIDLYMRRMEFYYLAKIEKETLKGEIQSYLQAYCQGVNDAMKRHWPFEFKLTKLPLEPWSPADTLAITKLMSFLGLAQNQQDMEKFIIQSLKSEVPLEFLKLLFEPHLDQLSANLNEIIKKLKLFHLPVPQNLFHSPSLKASNNWVLSGKKSSSGNPLACTDPHLDVQRLPSVWYEMKTHADDNFAYGITMPGIPGIIMGRTKQLSFNFTYGFMDTLDYFIEDIKEQKFKLEGQYKELNTRQEEIKRKNNSSVWLNLNKTECGRLECTDYYREGQPSPLLEDGYHLSVTWTGSHGGAAKAIEVLANMPQCKTVEEAQELSSKLFISCNWLFSDTTGNIGYQQSGYLPIRKGSGLTPLTAWEEENHWKGIHPPHKLHRITNPKEGFLATANNDMSNIQGPLSINLSMGECRSKRIHQEINKRDRLDLEDMKALQSDVLSLQALQYVDKIKNIIPDTPSGRVLSKWDGYYSVDSKGAFLFEKFYHRLLNITFGEHIFGSSAWEYFQSQTALLNNYYHLFDRLLLEVNEEQWKRFFSLDRSTFFERSLDHTLKKYPSGKLKSWGKENSFCMHHIFFQDKYSPILKCLGFAKGPYPLPGCRATIAQGSLFKRGKRLESLAPSWRFISDMGENFAFTSLPGGIRDRCFSRQYTNDLYKWLNFQYKTLIPDEKS